MLFESLLIQLCQDQLITHLEDTQKKSIIEVLQKVQQIVWQKT